MDDRNIPPTRLTRETSTKSLSKKASSRKQGSDPTRNVKESTSSLPKDKKERQSKTSGRSKHPSIITNPYLEEQERKRAGLEKRKRMEEYSQRIVTDPPPATPKYKTKASRSTSSPLIDREQALINSIESQRKLYAEKEQELRDAIQQTSVLLFQIQIINGKIREGKYRVEREKEIEEEERRRQLREEKRKETATRKNTVEAPRRKLPRKKVATKKVSINYIEEDPDKAKKEGGEQPTETIVPVPLENGLITIRDDSEKEKSTKMDNRGLQEDKDHQQRLYNENEKECLKDDEEEKKQTEEEERIRNEEKERMQREEEERLRKEEARAEEERLLRVVEEAKKKAEDEKKKEEEERRRKEEEERAREEEEERLRKEREEQQRQEDERMAKEKAEEEARIRKEEEDRVRQEEEERVRREEEERIRKEEEERVKMEEERLSREKAEEDERLRKEEEERLRKEEEERLARERVEEEERMKQVEEERQQREEEEQLARMKAEEEERLKKDEEERVAREQAEEEDRQRLKEEERIARDKAEEDERKQKEEEERLAQEKEAEAERLRKEEEQLARMKAEEEERLRKEEEERLAREKAEQEEQARKAEEEARLRREEEERLKQAEEERRRKEEEERAREEEEERLRKEREEQQRQEDERMTKEKAEEEARLKQEEERMRQEEQDRLQREEDERIAREKAEEERLRKDEEEKKRQEEEDRLAQEKAEEEARIRKEEENRVRQEEEERLRKEEEERVRKEEEERLRKEEEERVRKEEEERLRKEEEERLRKEEEERLRKEEEERLRKEEEERLRKEEEERVRKEEEERLRKEEEERVRKEEEERARKEEEERVRKEEEEERIRKEEEDERLRRAAEDQSHESSTDQLESASVVPSDSSLPLETSTEPVPSPDISSPASPASHRQPPSLRLNVLNEILSTERTYVSQLSVFVSVFVEPCRKQKDELGISDDQLKSIFGHVSIILNTNTVLLSELTECIERKGGDTIGPVITQMAAYLNCYKPYVNNYPRAMATLEQAKKKSKKLRTFFKTCSNNPKSENFPIESFLILPVQRLPRYKMLLEQLLKYTDREDTQYAEIEKALASIGELAESVNSTCFESAERMGVLNFFEGMKKWQLKQGVDEKELIEADLIITPTRRLIGKMPLIGYVSIPAKADDESKDSADENKMKGVLAQVMKSPIAVKKDFKLMLYFFNDAFAVVSEEVINQHKHFPKLVTQQTEPLLILHCFFPLLYTPSHSFVSSFSAVVLAMMQGLPHNAAHHTLSKTNTTTFPLLFSVNTKHDAIFTPSHPTFRTIPRLKQTLFRRDLGVMQVRNQDELVGTQHNMILVGSEKELTLLRNRIVETISSLDFSRLSRAQKEEQLLKGEMDTLRRKKETLLIQRAQTTSLDEQTSNTLLLYAKAFRYSPGFVPVFFFVIPTDKTKGRRVAVVGDVAELGEWDVGRAFEKSRAGGECVVLRTDQQSSFKLVVEGENGMEWEDGENRTMIVSRQMEKKGIIRLNLVFNHYEVFDVNDNSSNADNNWALFFYSLKSQAEVEEEERIRRQRAEMEQKREAYTVDFIMDDTF